MSVIFDLVSVEQKLKYSFKDKSLLRLAFTHPSYSNERHVKSNQNLEYLGDSILNFVVAEYLFNMFNESDTEGDLTLKRAELVSAKPLSDSIERMNLSDEILLGYGESKNGNNRLNINADLFEAIIGAIYLDGGVLNVKNFIYNNLINCKIIKTDMNAKTALQELAQKDKLGKIEYKDENKVGKDNDPTFFVGLYIDDKKISSGSGGSKKLAQTNAAKLALEILKK